MTTRILIGLVFTLMLWSCNQLRQTKRSASSNQNTATELSAYENSRVDSIALFLEKALCVDTFEVDHFGPFLFFKSGYMLSKDEKSAVAIYSSTDTTYCVQLYSMRERKWELSDSIDGLDALPMQFDLIFDDYNFDEQTDLYIQVTASNGWSLSRGHLITIDPKTKKLKLHTETRDFANMTPDKRTKTVRTELWNGYNKNGSVQLTVFTNKWIAGKLKTIRKKRVTVKAD